MALFWPPPNGGGILFVRIVALVAVLAGGILLPASGQAAIRLGNSFSLHDGDLTYKNQDETIRTGRDLIGQVFAVVLESETLDIRLDDFTDVPDGGRNRLYRFSARVAGQGPFANLCRPDPQGREVALAIPDERGGVSLTCTSGAEGKCILFGYRPWDTKGNVSLRDFYQACIHMLRADYGGDDVSYTKNGTLIAFEDSLGIRMIPEGNDMPFEAAWGPDGAICVARGRIPKLADIGFLGEHYPHLIPVLGGGACQEAKMRAEPRALLINRSTIPRSKSRR